MIYVDPPVWYNGRQWCHMATDGDLGELHRFAISLGLGKGWFQDHNRVPHYDLTPRARIRAIKKGAVQVTAKELFLKCKREAVNDER